jgi:hypothetical protein
VGLRQAARWHQSLSRQRQHELHAAIGHDLTPGPAPRLGWVLIWTGAVLALVVGFPLGLLLDLGRGVGLVVLPFAALALLGNYLYDLNIHRRKGGYPLTDAMLVALWDADQRLRPSR